MTTHFFAGLSALAISLILAAPARAEEADDQSTIIVIAQNITAEAQARADKTPGGTDVVDYADYADKTVISLRDALAFSPGVYLQPRYGQEVRISIRGSGLSRGFHMRGLTLLQDGIPINLADDNGDFQELDPVFLSHLEVYRGANALRFGSGTLGGAVGGVTPTGLAAPGLYLRADAGSFETFRGLVTYGASDDVGDVWIGASAETSNGDRAHAERAALRFHGNVGLAISENVTTRFYASINQIRQDIPGSLNFREAIDTPRIAAPASLIQDAERNIDSFRLQNRTTLTFGDSTLIVGAFANIKTLDHPIFQVIDQRSTDRGFFGRYEYEGDMVEATLGGELRYGTTRSRRFVNVAGEPGAKTVDADLRARTANIYGELRVKPVTGLSLIAGGIYADGFRQQDAVFRSINARADFHAFSPKFGLLYQPTQGVTLFANASRSAEFPGFTEVIQTVGGAATFVNLDAQRAWTYEIGARGSIGSLAWDLALYRADIDGELLQYTVDDARNIPASTFNADRTRHDGIEASLRLAASDWLQLTGVYAYSDFRFRDDVQFGDNRLPVVPRHVLRGEARFDFGRVHIAPAAEWVPDGAFADYANKVQVPPYALLSLTAGAQLTDRLDLFVDARNITGKRKIGDISAVIDASALSFGAPQRIYSPVESRGVFGGVRARF